MRSNCEMRRRNVFITGTRCHVDENAEFTEESPAAPPPVERRQSTAQGEFPQFLYAPRKIVSSRSNHFEQLYRLKAAKANSER